jgi:hypothetical protein
MDGAEAAARGPAAAESDGAGVAGEGPGGAVDFEAEALDAGWPAGELEVFDQVFDIEPDRHYHLPLQRST